MIAPRYNPSAEPDQDSDMIARSLMQDARAFGRLAGDDLASRLLAALAREAAERHARRGVAGRR
jgi:hypothetical protein